MTRFRRGIPAVVAVLALLATGCSTNSPPTAEIPPRPGPDKSLEAQMSVENGELSIRYTFTNESEAPVVVFNGLPAQDGPGPTEPDPNAVYLHDDTVGTAFIGKELSAPPNGYTGPIHTLRGTVLAPHEQLTEQVTVPLPLLERGPYQPSRPFTHPIGSAQFCLDFAPTSEVTPIPGGTEKHPLYAHDNSTGVPYTACPAVITLPS